MSALHELAMVYPFDLAYWRDAGEDPSDYFDPPYDEDDYPDDEYEAWRDWLAHVPEENT